MAYEAFLQANPTPERRIEALLSMTSPDLKGVALWSMEPGVPYTHREINSRTAQYAGHLPVITVWPYFDRERNGRRGSLQDTGAVVDIRSTSYPWNSEEKAYVLTDAGNDFGRPAAALAVRMGSLLAGRTIYSSMWKLLGFSASRGETRRMLAVYRIIELLANAKSSVRSNDIVQQTGLTESVVSSTLNSLAYSGVIDYESMHKATSGKRTKGIQYEPTEKLGRANPDHVFVEARQKRKWFREKSYLTKVLDYLRTHGRQSYEDISTGTRLSKAWTSSCLSLLTELGYLSAEFQGIKRSRAAANGNTTLFWRQFLEPTGIAATGLDPSAREFRSAFEYYDTHANEGEAAARRQVNAYDRERIQAGFGEEILDGLILAALSQGRQKTSDILQGINDSNTRHMTSSIVSGRLKGLVDRGVVRHAGKRGYYELSD